MTEYRVFVIGSDGHFVSATELICESDEAAVEQASTLLQEQSLEVWSGDRFVIRLYAER